MPFLHLLGTGAALSSPDRTTTMLAIEGRSTVVVDCGGDVVQRLLLAGIDPGTIRLLFLTHEHPDHVSGFPLFMEKIWLSGRREPIAVRGPSRALDQARRIFEAFNTAGWEGLPGIEWREIPMQECVDVWGDQEWRITASPGNHSVPVLGLRVEHLASSRSIAYSADTERSRSIETLAAGVDILVHEATGSFAGHSSIEDAAEVARAAGVGRLLLVHLPPEPQTSELARATERFSSLELGRDGARYAF